MDGYQKNDSSSVNLPLLNGGTESQQHSSLNKGPFLPEEDIYHDGDSENVSAKFSQLIDGDEQDEEKNTEQTSGEPIAKNDLGLFPGVYVPCMLGIIGAILFLRLGWSVGQAGIIGAMLTYSLATLTVVLTSLSIAAISTNGTVRGGGAYYMISRTLGPEFGGAVGVVFYAANTVGVTFYLVAFGEELLSLTGNIPGVGSKWTQIIMASLSLFVCLLVSLTGATYFSKFNIIVFLIQMFSIAVGLFSFLVRGSGAMEGYTGLSLETLKENLWVDYQPTGGKDMDFFKVFIVVFPAMTGVMAGANMSGDLKDPGKSIGRGTLMAVFTAYGTYIALIFAIGASVKRHVLLNNLNVMQDISPEKLLVAIGIIASCISSALGNLVSSGRILQALARDDLFPVLRVFQYGTKSGDEPILGILISYVIAQGCIFMGNLNAVASLISQFFLLVYMFTNLACFTLRIAGAPNFRPKFRYFSWHTALAGALCCAVILFISGPVTASISVVILILVWLYISYSSPAAGWGDVAQALIFHQVRKYLLRLDERKAHAKFWRPSLMVFMQDPSNLHAKILLDFCNNVKKGGLYIVGSIMVGNIATVSRSLPRLRNLWLEFVSKFNIKAFIETGIGPSARVAYQNLVVASGLGGMKPHTVCMPLFSATQLFRSLSDEGILTPDGNFEANLSSYEACEKYGSERGSLYLENGRMKLGSGMEFTLRFSYLGLGESLETNNATSDQKTSSTEKRIMSPLSKERNGPVTLGETARATSVKSFPVSATSHGGDFKDRSHRAENVAASIAQLHGYTRDNRIDDESTVSNSSDKRKANNEDAETESTQQMRQAEPIALPLHNVKEFMNIAKDVLYLRRNLLLTRNFESLDKELIVSFRKAASKAAVRSELRTMKVDVWLPYGVDLGSSGSASLALQLAHSLHNTDIWSKNTSLRVVSIVKWPEEEEAERQRILEMLDAFRFSTDLRVISLYGSRRVPTLQILEGHNATAPKNDVIDVAHNPVVINEVIRHNTENSCLVFLPLPVPPEFTPPEEEKYKEPQETVSVALGRGSQMDISLDVAYAYDLEVLTKELPPCVLTGSANVEEMVTTQL
eukprot:gb/GECG01005705.1/.p1 GENE.gb/GECG01005705.1/~~gb/GECG01005705.1/.p1  ORF type:complete len:1090 (+),score=107.31 gb/GECG01005705.1/:1-3270(+)